MEWAKIPVFQISQEVNPVDVTLPKLWNFEIQEFEFWPFSNVPPQISEFQLFFHIIYLPKIILICLVASIGPCMVYSRGTVVSQYIIVIIFFIVTVTACLCFECHFTRSKSSPFTYTSSALQ